MSRRKVLIVDDEPRNVQLLEAIVGSCDVDTASATNGRDALAMFKAESFDLVLLDVMMPKMDGFETLAAMRAATSPDEHIPIVLVTALAAREDRMRGLEAGADDFLTKPIDSQEVRCRVRLFLELRQTQLSLKRRAEELQREKAARAELAAMIVHDLKNPLAAISGNVAWIVSQIARPRASVAEISEALVDVSEGTQRLLKLISTLLDVEKAESQQLVVTPALTAIAPMLQMLAREHARDATDRGVTIEVAADSGLQATLDSELITRAIENLVLNALRYAGRGGRVALEARASGDELELVVANTGVAIAPEQRAQLFQKYATTERRGDNLGLGLYFCRLVCEQHGGTISAEVGEGFPTRMTIRLPLHGR